MTRRLKLLYYDQKRKVFLEYGRKGKAANPQPTIKVLAGTGHRTLGDNVVIVSDGAVYNIIREKLIQLLLSVNPQRVISGMAIGFDLALADAACQARIPFTAAVPFKGHGSSWSKVDKSKHNELLQHASDVVYTSEKYTTSSVYFIRDKWMVDNSDSVVTFYDGRGVGGTKVTVEMALKQNKPVVNIWKSAMLDG